MKKRFLDPVFSSVLKKNAFENFQALWGHEGELVEEGNNRIRSGMSHVVRMKLDDTTKTWTVYMKRQEHHLSLFTRLFLRPKSICARELRNIQLWQKIGIPTTQPLYFEQMENPIRAILITKGLTDYVSLEEWLSKVSDHKRRQRAFALTAQLFSRIHQNGWVHRCFFPKHLFIRECDGAMDMRVIDLEKAKRCFVTKRRVVNELSTFIRRCEWQDQTEVLQFLKAYWNTKKFDFAHRRMLKGIEKRIEYKRGLYK